MKKPKKISFFSALIYATNFHFNKEIEQFSEEELKTKIGESLFEKLKRQEGNCILDLDPLNFENICFDLNEILLESSLFFEGI